MDSTNAASRRDFLQSCAVLGGTVLPTRLLAGNTAGFDQRLKG